MVKVSSFVHLIFPNVQIKCLNMIWKCIFIFTGLVCILPVTGTSSAPSNYTISDWSPWTACIDVPGTSSKRGEKTRARTCVDDLGDNVTWSECNCTCSNNETKGCFLPVDGSWGKWGGWKCISNTFTRYRTCSDPRPAYGGQDCVGDSQEEDPTLFLDGGWTSWTNYSACSVPMGHGTKYQTRECTNPEPCGVLAQHCVGANYSEADCEEFPPCLQGSVFGGNYMTKDDPLVLYTSANIEVYPRTQITCSHLYVISNWTLYSVADEAKNETHILNTTQSALYIPRGEFPQGLYRLYVYMSYTKHFEYGFVEGYMYFRLQLPPPNVFIQGGSGRMSNPGTITIDAWTGSYDLTKGPGHRDNMDFSWSCLEFPTNSLDMLMSFIVPDSFAFMSNVTTSRISWDFMNSLVDLSKKYLDTFPLVNQAFFNETFVYQHVNLENISSPDTCLLYNQTSGNPCYLDNVITAESNAVLQEFLNSSFIEEIKTQRLNAVSVRTDIENVLPLLKLDENITSSEIGTIENDFLPSMNDLIRYTRILSELLLNFKTLQAETPKENYTISTLKIFDEQLAKIAKQASNLANTSFPDLILQEMRIYELIFKMLENNNCESLSTTNAGYAQLYADPNHPKKALGYVVTVKISIAGAENTYQQKIQVVFPESDNVTIPEINTECYLNCKPRVATSLMMSIRVKCTTCPRDDEKRAVYKWNLVEYDPTTKATRAISDWESWLETDPSDPKFVVKANSFRGLSYYLLTVKMNVSNSWSEMQMILETTNPPYGGICHVTEVSSTGQVDLELRGWKDEGFRRQQNTELDWKEQISYRIFQEDTKTKEKSLVYEGYERIINGLYFNYGYKEVNWFITIYAEVLDVFGDFTTCNIAPIQMLSPMKDTSVDDFLVNSQELIETAIEQSNTGLVSMTLETTISTSNREELPQTSIIDELVESPETWSSIGEGSTFENLFQNLMVTDQNYTNQEILKEGMQNMTAYLKTSTTSLKIDNTVLQRQMAFCSGSSMEIKQLVTQEAMVSALSSTNDVIENFINTSKKANFPVYEDYLSTSEAILRSVDNMLNILIPKLSPDIPETDDIYQIADQYSSGDAINAYDGSGFSPQERALFASMSVAAYKESLNSSLEMANQTVPNVQKSILELGTVLKEITYRKQFEVEVTRPGLKTSMEKVQVDQEIDRKNLKIKFDLNTELEENLQVTQYSKTPFIWDSEAKNIQSPTVHIALGNRTSLPSVKTKFSVSSSVTKRTVVLDFPDDTDEYISRSFAYKIWWKNPSDILVFSFERDNSTLGSFSHVVYAKKDSTPTSLDYEWTKIITQGDWSDGGASCLLPKNFCSKPCLMFFAVHVTFIPKSGHSRKRRSVSNSTVTNSTSSVSYDVSGWTTGCRVWDGQQWDKTSCQVSPETNNKETVCDCQNPPGDNFATSFFVPPNSIDFSTVFEKFDIIGNGAVFGTVTAIIVLYVIGLLVGRRYDRKDREKWKLFYMSDNLKTDKYVYLVTVFTGLSRNSGTTSNVSFIIASLLKDTGVRHLTDGDKKGFETGSVFTYVMTVQDNLGDLTFLNIWHDNSGKGGDASWNLIKVVVEDAHTGKRFVFFCNQWLSLDSHESSIQCTVPVATPESLQTFNFNFTENTRENVTDSHLWLSIFMRPEKSTFTRCERLSCCVTLLFLTMISNAMFYGKDEAVEQIRVGPIKFALSSIYISFVGIIMTFPVVLTISMIFKKSKWQKESDDRDKDNVESFMTQKKEMKFRMPPKCLYVAYALVVLSVLLSGFFVVLYSMEWGKAKSEEWLKTFFMSFLESLFIVDPIKVIAVAVFVSIITKKSLDDSKYETTKLLEQSQTRALAFARDTKNIACYGKPYDEQTLENMKQKRLQELRVKSILVELLLYLCFLTILYFISYNNRDFNSFHITRHLNHQLLQSPTKNSSFHTLRYSKVRSTEHLYDWLKDTLIPFVFPLTWYNGQTLNSYERQNTKDQANYRLGPVRLRQLRVKETGCSIPLILDATCYADYGIPTEDERSNCQSWGLPSCDVTKTRWSSKAWQFTSATEIWGVPTIGMQGTYGGGGYVADLGIHRTYANVILDELYNNLWIDRQTRAVFVEFTQYNSNTNLFTFVSLMTELPQTGGVLTTAHVYPLRVYQHVGNFGVFIFLCEIVLMVCALAFFVYFIIQIVKHKKAFFRDSWRLFDLIIIVLTVVGIAMYLTRMLFTSWTITKFTEQKLKFVNFGHIALWDEILNAFLSFLVFLSTIRILRVLNYSRSITHLAGVLSNARRNLVGCFFMFALIFVAYAGFGYLLFGSDLETYKNMFVSITTIVNSLVGRNSLHGLIMARPVIAEFYYFTFVTFVIWIVMTMMCATLNRSIREIRNKIESHERMYEIDDLLRDLLKDFWHKIHFKLPSVSKTTHALRRTITSVTSGDVSLILQEFEEDSSSEDEQDPNPINNC